VLPEIPRAAAGRRVLVADDNRDAADSLAFMLRAGGHEVRIAYDGQQALDLAETFRPSLALIDIGMPRMNGYDCARRMRGQPHGQDMTLIALTGWGQPDDRRRSLNAGFDHHLVKPVDPSLLERLLAAPRRAGGAQTSCSATARGEVGEADDAGPHLLPQAGRPGAAL